MNRSEKLLFHPFPEETCATNSKRLTCLAENPLGSSGNEHCRLQSDQVSAVGCDGMCWAEKPLREGKGLELHHCCWNHRAARACGAACAPASPDAV